MERERERREVNGTTKPVRPASPLTPAHSKFSHSKEDNDESREATRWLVEVLVPRAAAEISGLLDEAEQKKVRLKCLCAASRLPFAVVETAEAIERERERERENSHAHNLVTEREREREREQKHSTSFSLHSCLPYSLSLS